MLLCHLLHDPEMLNTKCMGEFATQHWFRPFRCAKISLNIGLCAQSCSTRITPGKLLNVHEVARA